VVFHNPSNTSEDYIKRIIGLPGDTVEVQNSTVFVNGQSLHEDFPHNPIPIGSYMPPVTVADGQLFVMGDNRPNSSDSRAFGPISQELVVGQGWLRIWPLDKFGLVEHEDLQ
jgi:signal peptidase I